MPQTHAAGYPPDQLLLATDLSARCDRALDRAAQLAGEWQAGLVAVNVLDPSASPDQALAWAQGASDEQLLHTARQQLARDLEAAEVSASLRLVRSANPAKAIQDTAADTRAGLVITGVSTHGALGRLLLGCTVEKLAGTLPQPMLVVRNRVPGPYRQIVVATDFSDASRHALIAAAHLFPARELTLYHARAMSMSGLATTPLASGGNGIEDAECEAFLATTTLPGPAQPQVVIERSAIEVSLSRYVRDHNIDLVVIGNTGRSGIMGLLLGSTATRLLSWLPCDILLVPTPAPQI